ncbi:MAG TPA: GNAT family N-acetyltransferase [Polyangia bacterium]|nr:GNAT family N-acetyltransferase [Polyangia bacterium]
MRPRVSTASPVTARAQAAWIAAMEPWKGLGYTAAGLGRYLARKARERRVLVLRTGRADPLGLAVVDDGVLLGGFIALLAVRPEAAGQGLGAALVEEAGRRVGRTRRWLYTSADGKNRGALRFYGRLGFRRVGRLPDLVRAGRVEILLRRPTRAGKSPN